MLRVADQGVGWFGVLDRNFIKACGVLPKETRVGHQLNPDWAINFGAAYRISDAAEVLIGADYKDLRVALSYDVNVSSLSEVSDYQGGFEIAASYIIKIFKTPEVDPAILCPRF